MSAAPRPVTATVTKRRNAKEERLQRSVHEISRVMDSSSDSTLSLCSVLDHDSYESVSNNSSDGDSDSSTSERLQNKVLLSESVTEPTSTKVEERPMSAWETWLVRKEKILRKKSKVENRKRNEELKKIQLEKQEKEEKIVKAEIVRQEWLESKNKEEHERKEKTRQKQIAEQEEKENNEIIVQERSKEKFEEWQQHKLQLEKEKRAREKEEKQQKLQQERDKKLQSEAAFEAWCRKAQRQPKPLNNSFGYTCGKLTGYHDRSCYPVPSFYNPIPWRGPDIPKQNTEKHTKKKKGAKYKWDPNKYY